MKNQPLNEKQLLMYANKFLMDNYGFGLSVPLKLNGRLKKTYGRFRSRVYVSGRTEPVLVELNKTFVENNSDAIVLDVLRHELVHYALFVQGKPFQDYHPVFENELKRLKVVSQDTINKYSILNKKHIYVCRDCSHEFKLNRKLKNDGIFHECNCGGKLLDKGKKMVKI